MVDVDFRAYFLQVSILSSGIALQVSLVSYAFLQACFSQQKFLVGEQGLLLLAEHTNAAVWLGTVLFSLGWYNLVYEPDEQNVGSGVGYLHSHQQTSVLISRSAALMGAADRTFFEQRGAESVLFYQRHEVLPSAGQVQT